MSTARKYTGDSVFGGQLKEIRLERGLTLRGVEAETGISNPNLSQIENGVVMPTVRTAAILAAFYEANLNELCAHFVEKL